MTYSSFETLIVSPLPIFARCFGFLLPLAIGRLPLRNHETILLAAALTCGAYAHGTLSTLQPALSVEFLRTVLLELLVGLLGGAIIATALEVPAIAARLLDSSRGALIAEQLLPGQEQRASSLEALAALAAPAVFLGLGLHRPVLSTLFRIPGELGSFDIQIDSAQAYAALAQSVLRQSVLLVTPVLAVLLAFDLIAAAGSRAYPRLCLSHELAPVRLLLGLLLGSALLLELHPELNGVRTGIAATAEALRVDVK